MFVIIGANGRPAFFFKQYDPPLAAFSTMEKAQAYIDFYIEHLQFDRQAARVEIKLLDDVRESCRQNGISTYLLDPTPVTAEGVPVPF